MKQAIITVKDEVNCKIIGLDLDTRKKLVSKFKYDIPNAMYMPSYKLGRWDGKVAFFQLGGSTYINLLPDVIPILIKDGYNVVLDDQRAYQIAFEFNEVKADSYSHNTWPVKHTIAGEPIVLRDYQAEIINEFLKNPQSLQEIATGSGKTLVTAALSERVEQYGRSIVIVPNKSLVTQTEEDYINMQLDVGVFYGDRKEFSKQHTICTWQSLNSLLKQTKNHNADITIHDFLQDVVCVIVDECFDGDTLIKTPTSETPIKDIKKGDIVINLDESGQCYKEDIVVEVHENLADSHSEYMLELTFDNVKVINVTANHKFLTSNGWVRADCLTEDLEVVTINTYNKKSRYYIKLISRKIIKKPKKVYNLHIKNSHNYIANDAVVSNCHGIKADALKGLLTGAMAKVPLRWGLTGTIPKEDFEFQALHTSIGNVINRISASELQDRGFLANCYVNIVQLKDYVEHKNYQSELKYLLTNEDRLDTIAKLVSSASHTGNTLVLVDRISAGQGLVERLNNAVFVSGATKGKKRQEHYNEIADVDDKIIVATYGVAAVGINIPRIFNLVLIEPGKSFVRVIQSIGRGLRKANDKDEVQIWDITSTCKFAKRHLTKRKKYYKEAGYKFSLEKVDWQ
jgi:superfamily II DNA or RNA helicase